MPQPSTPCKQVQNVAAVQIVLGSFMSPICIGGLVMVDHGGDLLTFRLGFSILGAAFLISLVCGIYLCRANKAGNIQKIRHCMFGHTACIVLLVVGLAVGINGGHSNRYYIGGIPLLLFIIFPYLAMGERMKELKAMNCNTGEEGTTDQRAAPV